MLEYLAARATPGVEAVEAGAYRRSISLNGSHGYFELALGERNNTLTARIEFGDPCLLFLIIERIGAIFDLNADWAVIARTLRADLFLAPRVKTEEGVRVPGCWDGFEFVTRAILGQQTQVRTVTMLAGRLAHAFGAPFPAARGLTHLFPTPEVLADADLSRIGLPRAKAATIRAFARAVCDGQIQFAGIVDGDAFLSRLRKIPGIGKWVAQCAAMGVLRDPDGFPSSDLVLRRVADRSSARELEDYSQVWRPWRAYAAMLLWHGADDMSGETASRESGALKASFIPFETEKAPAVHSR